MCPSLRHGIFFPQYFSFNKILIIFLVYFFTNNSYITIEFSSVSAIFIFPTFQQQFRWRIVLVFGEKHCENFSFFLQGHFFDNFWSSMIHVIIYKCSFVFRKEIWFATFFDFFFDESRGLWTSPAQPVSCKNSFIEISGKNQYAL